MDKETEIKHLQALKDDTYFAEFFTKQDIDLMCENIRSDFAIESGCDFNYNRLMMNKRISEEVEKSEKFISDFIYQLHIDGYDTTPAMETLISQFVGNETLIVAKLRNGISLTTEQVDYIEKKLNDE